MFEMVRWPPLTMNSWFVYPPLRVTANPPDVMVTDKVYGIVMAEVRVSVHGPPNWTSPPAITSLTKVDRVHGVTTFGRGCATPR
ncbi:MAG: hypothetical protein L3K13_02180 [Thermoplasmata archaeon]|nr:hypothetical protein [Thermoplasmata archaeon]